MLQELHEQKIHGTREYPFSCYLIKGFHQDYYTPVHWHESVEILYVKSGQLDVGIEENSYILKKDDFIIINARELHRMKPIDLETEYNVLIFPWEMISCQTMDDFERKLMGALRGGSVKINHISANMQYNDQVRQIIKELISDNETQKKRAVHIRTRILLLQLLFTAVDQNELYSTKTKKELNLQRQILLYVQMHFTEKLTLAEMAAEFHMSEKYFSRYFHDNYGITFSEYIKRLRISYAKSLLETSEMPITEVALNVGFPNVSFFIRTFKDVFGISPAKYRKAN